MKGQVMKRFLMVVGVLFGVTALLIYGYKPMLNGWHAGVHSWHSFRLGNMVLPEGAMDLSRYRVTIDGKTIPALEDDLSALTYNREKNTLWALLNSDPVVVELSLEGELLRSIRIEGVRDMEGFTHVSGDRYVIAEERTHRLLVVDIPGGVDSVHTEGVPTLVVGIGSDTNKGFEGLSWDDDGQRLLVVKERNPMRVIEITGFVSFVVGEPMNIGIREIKSPDSPELFMRDLSSITHVRGVGHKLFLSDESHMLVEYDDERQSISLLDLRAGRSGLESTIPQAEGVAVDSELNIYIVSEPNLFYRFSPQ
jgi:uncharacterized protein YjiK